MNKTDKTMEELNNSVKDVVKKHPEICKNPAASIEILQNEYHAHPLAMVDRDTTYKNIDEAITSACDKHGYKPSSSPQTHTKPPGNTPRR